MPNVRRNLPLEHMSSQKQDSHVHLDIVGSLTPSKDFLYVLTCLDRFSGWPEAFSMRNQTAETVAEIFFAGLVARLGAPEIITTDQGQQFKSDIFRSLARFLGIQELRTAAYNPKCNGVVERFYRSLKSSIKCHATERWKTKRQVLPSVSLGIRNTLKEDIGATPDEMVYGCPLRLPGEFFTNAYGKDFPPCSDFLQILRNKMRELRPTSLSKHGTSYYPFVNKDLFFQAIFFLESSVFFSLYNNHIKAHLKEEVVQPDQYEHDQIDDVSQGTFQEDLPLGNGFYLVEMVHNNESVRQHVSCSLARGNDSLPT
ncbi:Gag-Pol polyprotein [Araneus ventricosus]|uniref:Gag-Pol polyprotein n=1 Tax=Araneus ventricosus TaxID=182803 RepID=A0A4Y2N2A1_ARAVE|nr:Gag-Pol polyprotein [Araneus ventricosus]